MAVEAALAQWLVLQAERATWPLTTCARAENASELSLHSRTGMRGELGLQRTVAYVSPHRPQTAPHPTAPPSFPRPLALRQFAIALDNAASRGQSVESRPSPACPLPCRRSGRK